MTLGLAMDGNIPISVFPRWNFLLYGINQLINHIDKYNVMVGKENDIKVIIRTGIGSQRPLHPQHQHIGDFTESIEKMCTTIDIIKLVEPEDIFPAYEKGGAAIILTNLINFFLKKKINFIFLSLNAEYDYFIKSKYFKIINIKKNRIK